MVSVGTPGVRVYGMYLVKEDMRHAISGVNCDHAVKVGLGFFEKVLG